MRLAAGLSILLLAACGGAATSADRPTGASPTAMPSASAETAMSPSAPSATAMTAVTLESLDGASPMGYLEYLPRDYAEDGEPSPLLVFLHGGGEAGDGSEASLALVDDLGVPMMIAEGEWPSGPPLWPGSYPFVVLSPQYATVYARGECGFGEELNRFLEFAVERYNVDEARVYLVGISCGAIGAWDYLASHGAERVAAAVLVSGHALWALKKAGCAPFTEVPLWVHHGAEDDIVRVHFVEGQIDQILACGGAESVEATLTVYPDADHVGTIERALALSTDVEEPGVYEWLLEHTKEPAAERDEGP